MLQCNAAPRMLYNFMVSVQPSFEKVAGPELQEKPEADSN